MTKILIALGALLIVGAGTYYLVFNKSSSETPAYPPTTTGTPNATTDTWTPKTQSEVSPPSPKVIPPQSPAPTPKPSEVPAPESVAVEIKDFLFSPSTLSVKAGTKVTWTNTDSAPHTVTSDSGTTLNSKTLSNGDSYSVTFEEAGTIAYHCAIHPMMMGKVIVGN